MNCNCNKKEILSIPRGNPFRLHICGLDIVPGDPDATFANVGDMNVYIVSFPNVRTEVEFEAISPDIILTVPIEVQRRAIYGIEVTGIYNGHPWRWKTKEIVFRIVDSNCDASEQGMETFGVETYYLRDVVWVEFEDDIMTLYSDGHVRFEEETLILQDTDNTTFEIEGDILYITTEK